jgi:hypothetical protein
VPVAGVLAASLVGPNSTHNAIEHRAATTVFAHPQFSLATMQVPKAFSQVISFLTVSHQKRPQSRFFDLYDLPPIQVRFERLEPRLIAHRGQSRCFMQKLAPMQPSLSMVK